MLFFITKSITLLASSLIIVSICRFIKKLYITTATLV